jgi:hypothetical protein
MNPPLPRALRAVRTLGLPLHAPGTTWATAGLLFAYYAASMARDLSGFDSPELALVAVDLGLGHPIGQPLHTVLGYLFAHLPFLSPLLGLNLLSALAGALAVIPAASLAEGFAGSADPAHRSRATTLRHLLLRHLVFLLWGTHAALWEGATRVEVYPLATFFALWAVAKVRAGTDAGADPTRALFAAGISLGLAASANPYVAIIAALGVTPAVLSHVGTRKFPLRAGVAAVVGGLVGIVPYVYVPVVATRMNSFVWGRPVDGARLRHYFLGLDYSANRTLTKGQWLEQGLEWFGWAAERNVLGLVIVGLLAAAALVRAKRPVALAPCITFGLSIALVASNTVWEPDLPDYISYLAVPLWLSAGAVAAVTTIILSRAGSLVGTAAAVAVSCLGLLTSPMLWERTRHEDYVARVIAERALKDVPPRGVLIADSSHFVAPLLYLQHIEGQRRDVITVPTGFASSSWFWEQLLAEHHDLTPFALEGAGGRVGRVARLLTANPGRELRFTSSGEASAFGSPVCAMGSTYAVGRACVGHAAPPAPLGLRKFADALGSGSPNTDGLIAGVALERAAFLLASNAPALAVHALLDGVPSRRTAGIRLDGANWSRVAPRTVAVNWKRRAPIGEPARNLLLASILLGEAGLPEAAARCFAEALADGLPEALELRGTAAPSTPAPTPSP